MAGDLSPKDQTLVFGVQDGTRGGALPRNRSYEIWSKPPFRLVYVVLEVPCLDLE